MGRIECVITQLREWFSDLTVGAALALVAFCAGFISYTHICALTLEEDQSWKTAHLMPLAIDGQIVIGSAYYMAHDGRRRYWGLLGIVPGVLESLFANWESGIAHGLLAAGWATVPAQAFACSTFLFERWVKFRHAKRSAVVTAPAAVPEVAHTVLSRLPLISLPNAADVNANLARLNGSKAPGPVKNAKPDDRLPLPEGEELRTVVEALSQNEIARKYRVSRYGAGQLKDQLKRGELDAKVSEQVA